METTHAVGRLIDDVKGVNGWSDEHIARRARERNHDLSRQNISRIRTERIRTVSPELVETLADGLNVPAARVWDAYLEAFGYPPRSPATDVVAAVNADGRLSTEDKAALLALHRFMVRRRRKFSDVENAADEQVTETLDTQSSPDDKTLPPPVTGDGSRDTYVHHAAQDDGDGLTGGSTDETTSHKGN